MKRFTETLRMMYSAMRYSLSFCWRNSKKETVGRLFISILSTVLMYSGIQATGHIVNAVQKLVGTFSDGHHSFGEVFRGGLFVPVISLAVVMSVGVIIGRLNWFYRSRWNQVLHFANQRELNEHRATLDVACTSSKEYDDLARRIEELPHSWRTRTAFADDVFNLSTTLLSFVIFGASLMWYQPVYMLVLVLFGVPMMIVEFRLVSAWWNLSQELVPLHKSRSVLERPYRGEAAFRQALMFNQLPVLRREIDINVGQVIEANDKIRRMGVRSEITTRLVSVVGLGLVIVHAIWSIVSHSGAIGTFTIVLAAARTFQGNLEAIVSAIAEQWSSARGVILIEKDFFGLRALVQTENPVKPCFDNTPEIRFDRVCFAYPNTDGLVLKNVSFAIKPGSKVALVGKSGNGKSTIAALLMRHYDPTGGTVYAGDINLRNIEPSEWSKVASALTQEYTVLERRIGAEIASSRLDQVLDPEAVSASSRFANFDEVVATDPQGFESQIGVDHGGRDFSGGERQRLALARVHYRGTPILILDEPDAKLDPESAEKVINHILALRGVTVIMITHHVSRAERCDQVIVMGKGEVVEQGTPAELNARQGVYVSLREMDRKRLGQES